MPTTDVRPLWPHPNLAHYKKQAKDLLKAFRAGDPDAIDRVVRFNPRAGEGLRLTGAQLVVAREHGFVTWPRFASHIEALQRRDSPTAIFESAADAIAQGDAERLGLLLRNHPALAKQRSARSHRATLLHYTAANGVEEFRQKTPPNIAPIAAALLKAGAGIDAVADIYGGSTTLSLAASSVHPQRAGAHIALLKVLLNNGALVDGVLGCAVPILSALRNGRGEAAQFLAGRGARLDLESAAGTGRVEAVRAILATGSFTAAQRAAGLAWACAYGHAEAATVLLATGSDPNESHFGQTPLHWAAMNAQAGIAELLLQSGASTKTLNQYGGTPLDQAVWSAARDDHPERYEAVIALVSAHRA